jgi:hypothetical protein
MQREWAHLGVAQGADPPISAGSFGATESIRDFARRHCIREKIGTGGGRAIPAPTERVEQPAQTRPMRSGSRPTESDMELIKLLLIIAAHVIIIIAERL